MLRVTEKKVCHQTAYLLLFENDNKVVSKSQVLYKTAIVEEDLKDYYFVYDPLMRPIKASFEYLNVFLKDKSSNTKELYLYALRMLYSFEDIIGTKLEEFTPTDIAIFKDFLLGLYRPGETIIFEGLSEHQPQTVNQYFSVYRNYLDFLGVENHFLKYKNNRKALFSESESATYPTFSYYKADMRIVKRREVPKYISIEDFKSIIQEIREKYSLREECIVRLMYETGLRLGEILGLTNEDIVTEKIDGKWCNCVYIRNRVSDKRYQQAKTVITPSSKKSYKTKAYNTLNGGYQIVFITDELCTLLDEYIEDAHESARERYSTRYYNSSLADSVCEHDENFYIFINNYGSRLSNVAWNKTLRKIFEGVGIHVDKAKIKENNLNHRFRHGFAMFQVEYCHTDMVELSKMLRHKSLSSTAIYYRPTISDEIKMKQAFTTDLYTQIPELRR